MITGVVKDRHILLPVQFRLAPSSGLTIEFVVDTGFTGSLTLPSEAIATMGLPFVYCIPAQLADGSYVEVAVHSATIDWNGLDTEVSILATGERPLLGTALLDGHQLYAQFREDGAVTVEGI